MQIDLKPFAVPCACGRLHAISVRGIWIEQDALERLPALVSENNWNCPVIICDDHTLETGGARAAALLPHSTVVCLPSADLHADEHGVSLANERLPPADVLIAVGAGTIHDITRFIAHEKKIPFLSLPTAASVDGFVSTVAAMTWKGCKKTFPAAAPMYVLADSAIFSKAPVRLNTSGVCDLLGKYIALADWKIAHLATGEYLCDTICQMELTALAQVEAHLADVRVGKLAACEELMFGLLLSGLAMQMVGNSRPASGAEHHLSHMWEMELIHPHIDALHGEKVGVGLLLAAQKYHAAAELLQTDICPAATSTGLETTLLERYVPAPLREELYQENTPDPLAAVDLTVLDSKRQQIAAIVHEIPSVARLREIMRIAGAKTDMADIGLSADLEELSLRLSPYVRNRLTLMRLLKLWGLN